MSTTTDEHEPKKTEEENKEQKYDDNDKEEEDGKEDSANPQEAHTDRNNYAGHKEADVIPKNPGRSRPAVNNARITS